MYKFLKISGIVFATALSVNCIAQDNDDTQVAPAPAPNAANSNWKPSLVNDGIIERTAHEYRVKPWKNIREIDVAYYHRVWKVIPVLEKQNQAFLYEGDEFSNGGSFIEILNNAVKQGEIRAYNAMEGGRFTIPITQDKLDQITGGGTEQVAVNDLETGEVTYKTVNKEFNINSVTKYLVKEDWVFDRNLGRQVVRIIGIAPMYDRVNPQTGEFMQSVPMYWIHYPTAREVLGRYEVYNPENLVKRMTWADYLEGGYYSSFITKYSKNNPTNEDLKDLKSNDLRGLIEGERVLNDLIEQEQTMWER